MRLARLSRRRPPVTRDATPPPRACRYRELREFRQGIPVVCIGNKIDVDPKVAHRLDSLTHVLEGTRNASPRSSAHAPVHPLASRTSHPYTP